MINCSNNLVNKSTFINHSVALFELIWRCSKFCCIFFNQFGYILRGCGAPRCFCKGVKKFNFVH